MEGFHGESFTLLQHNICQFNSTCAVCRVETMGKEQYFCMDNYDTCLDMMYTRPFTTAVDSQATCPGYSLALAGAISGAESWDIQLGVGISMNATQPPLPIVNAFQPDLFKLVPMNVLIALGSAPVAIFMSRELFGV